MNPRSSDSLWRKSSYSTGGQGQCVEVAVTHGSIVVRDTTDREGTMFTVGASAWTRFLATIK